MPQNFKIFRSSAGSGKTYNLALEYITLLVNNPANYSRILAVTFTNKATREMKERIVKYLRDISNGEEEGFLKALKMRLPGFDESTIRQRCSESLQNILHKYSSFQISTIDSFFQKIVRAFTREIGLSGNYALDLNTDKARQYIVDKIVDDLGSDEETTNWLLKFASNNVEQNQTWDVRKQIHDLCDLLFKEDFRASEKEVLAAKPEKVIATVKSVVKEFEQTMLALGRQAIELMDKYGMTQEDFKYKKGGVANYFFNVVNKNKWQYGSRVIDALNSMDGWCSPKAPNKAQVIDIVEGGLGDLLKEMTTCFDENILEYNTARAIQRNIYTFGLIKRMLEKLTAYRSEHDLLLISDLSVFLKEIINENDSPFIYEKTGERYDHFLLDEFQDTSGYQWHNFKPLIYDSLAQGELNLLVGDGKQSIYRWRGGDWSIILNECTRGLAPEMVDNVSLDTNWRSKENVVRFNNFIFSRCVPFMQAQFDLLDQSHGSEAIAKGKDDLAMLYKEGIQNVSPAKRQSPDKGSVNIRLFSNDEDEKWEERSVKATVETIANLIKKGSNPGDITILVRRKSEGETIVKALLDYQSRLPEHQQGSFHVVSNEALKLGASTALRALVAALKILADPHDIIARVELYCELQHLKGASASFHQFDSAEAINDQLPKEITHDLMSFQGKPMLQVSEKLIRLLLLNEHPGHAAYLQGFTAAISEFLKDNPDNLHAFLEWWDEYGQKNTVQASEASDAIVVMTIHKAKGLEFKNVIIPFCDWSFDHSGQHAPYMWCNMPVEYSENISRFPVRYTSDLVNSAFRDDYFNEKVKTVVDNLNVLYVAFTRAEDNLFVHGKMAKTDKEIKSASVLLRMLLDEDDHPLTLQEGDDNEEHWGLGAIQSYLAHERKMVPDIFTKYCSGDRLPSVKVKERGKDFFDNDTRIDKTNLGIVVHEVLSEIKREEDIPKILDGLQNIGRINHEQRLQVEELLSRAFEIEGMRAWFDPSNMVLTEQPIVTPSAELYQPDRVIIKGDKAIVVDFKTGEQHPKYRKQVRAYMDLLKAMGYQSDEGYLVYIHDGITVQV